MSDNPELYTRLYILELWQTMWERSTAPQRTPDHTMTWELASDFAHVLLAGPRPEGFERVVWSAASLFTDFVCFGSDASVSTVATTRFRQTQRELSLEIGRIFAWCPPHFHPDPDEWARASSRTPTDRARYGWFRHPTPYNSALWHTSYRERHRL